MIAALALLASAPSVSLEYSTFTGLSVSVMDIPIVMGSSFQLFDAASGTGLYSSRWAPQTVERHGDGRTSVRFLALDGRFTGTHSVERTRDGFEVRYRFTWKGDRPARLENALGLLWSSCFADGTAVVDDGTPWPLARPMEGARHARRVGASGERVRIGGSVITMDVSTDPPTRLSLLDGRGSEDGWALGRGALWVGQESVRIGPNQTVEFTAVWDIAAPGRLRPAPMEKAASASPFAGAVEPAAPLPLVPAPRERVERSGWLPMGTALAGEGAETAMGSLRARWRLQGQSGAPANLTTRVGGLGLPAEGFQIVVGDSGVEVSGQDEAGLGHGLVCLASLATVRAGQVGWKHQTVRDWPTIRWRGVHLFQGPPEWHDRLATNVLAPLRFNHVVVQCERTAWESLPSGPVTDQSKPGLAKVFAQYRGAGVEPIPLIQSLGHMEWLFANGRLKHFAVNPDVPYTLDVRRSEAREKIGAVWDEAVDLLGPKTVHFGLDEFGNRGLPDDPGLETRLWTAAVPYLDSVAKRHKVEAMAWGDVMLAPSEALGAAHAPSEAEAAKRRAVLPRSWRIADWHYAAEKDPSQYVSLPLWTKRGHRVVAASWDKPKNIEGTALAAAMFGTGMLQTTWAGHSTDEGAFYREPGQFAAYAEAASWAWSGKAPPAGAAGYVARALLEAPLEPSSLAGTALSLGALEGEARLGRVGFYTIPPIQLHTPISRAGREGASPVTLRVGTTASELALLVDCVAWLGDGHPLATVTVEFEDGSRQSAVVRYGAHARSAEDRRPSTALASKNGFGLFRMRWEKPGKVVSVSMDAGESMGGLRVHGATLVQ
ncbi:MAG: hypothetical protein AB7F50_01995 [Fimbriimonadaceae bacterium]